MKKTVWIDLSRLCWRGRTLTPSGIDRVEMAYARHFLDHSSFNTRFVARAGAMGARELPRAAMRAFLDTLEATWRCPTNGNILPKVGRLMAQSSRAPDPRDTVTIIPSHQNWHAEAWLKQRRGRGGRLVLFLHDVIPIHYPEYAREGGARRHHERITNALTTADAFIVNSAETARALAGEAELLSRSAPRCLVAPLGTEAVHIPQAPATFARPYFVTVGTIEPRKNHMLLLLLWRQMVEMGVADIPALVVIGRRGWENEQVVDLLQRSRALKDLVIERNDMGDAERARWIKGARALLMPSFAEGFGMPVNEALSLGTPVIASNLPVYGESAGDVPDYVDPLDGPSWRAAILDYASPNSAARARQLGRLERWRAPCWNQHFERVDNLLSELQAG